MSLYNVVLLSTTTAVVGFFLQDQHERSYILTSVFILLCVTITLCLVFVPKVREVAKDPHSTAKPQRAVIPNVKTKLSQDKGQDGKFLTDNKEDFILRLKKLTNQNDILKSNAVKV
jgi:Na+/melibiose symporter-like transporter